MNTRKMDTTSVFAITALLVAGLATVAMIAAAFGAFGSNDADPPAVDADDGNDDDDGATADPNADATEIATSSATAMAAVTSVEFELERGGAPIFIDEFERIALDSLRGQFSVPGRAQAELNVTVNDNLATRLGAVAVDDEVWISNPVTGDFETLPSRVRHRPVQVLRSRERLGAAARQPPGRLARRRRRSRRRAIPHHRHRAR